MHTDLKVKVDCNYWHVLIQGNMQNSWITVGNDSGVDEAAKKPFSHGNADITEAASADEAEKWKLELVSVWGLFSYASPFFSTFIYHGKFT